jgi:Helix-turn-helix domain
VTGEPETPGRARTTSLGSNRVKAVSTGPRHLAAAKSAQAVTSKHVVPSTSPPGVLRRRFRIAQVAEAFGCAPRTVRSWIEKGLLEREKIGNAVFIREDQIEAMLLGSTRERKSSNMKHKNRRSKNTSR